VFSLKARQFEFKIIFADERHFSEEAAGLAVNVHDFIIDIRFSVRRWSGADDSCAMSGFGKAFTDIVDAYFRTAKIRIKLGYEMGDFHVMTDSDAGLL
jgi:hypothetical protein